MKIARTGKTAILLTLVSLLTCGNFQSSSADDSMLWSSINGYFGAQTNTGVDIRSIPEYARVHDLSFSVPKSNPDVLVVGVRFDGPFDSAPLSASKNLFVGIRILSPNRNCVFDNTCAKALYIAAPKSWSSSYPYVPTAGITVDVKNYGTGGEQNEYKNTNCPAPWWIDTSDSDHHALMFQLSITCLGIPQTAIAYGIAGADVGITPIPYNFTGYASMDNPYWQLAAAAYDLRGGVSGVGKPYTSVRVTAPVTTAAPGTNADVLNSATSLVDSINNQIDQLKSTLDKKQTKKYQLACKKGAAIKYVRGSAPKCPSGYSQSSKKLLK
jgi:hypothetical protein